MIPWTKLSLPFRELLKMFTNRTVLILMHIVSNFLLLMLQYASSLSNIIDAINAGGRAHIDVNGITYRADPLEGEVGSVASDYGRRYIIGRVETLDQILYQTERFSLENFHYQMQIPVDFDANYVLVLKFCEVWFSAPNQKVFDVLVNEEHEVLQDLDIFAKVGRAVAHDELIPFRVNNGRLHINEEVSDFDGTLTITFVKKALDNPKINALYVLEGSVEDVPKLAPLEQTLEEEKLFDEMKEGPSESLSGSEFVSGPRQASPYELQDQSSMLMPILMALACFIPVLFCLCRL